MGIDLPRIAVLDSDDSDRRKRMLLAFSGIASESIGIDPGDGTKVYEDPPGKRVKAITTVLVALCHFGDRHLLMGVEARLTVFYGGYGGSDPRRKITDQEVIWRPVEGNSGALEPQEAAALLKYASDLVAGKPSARPVVLCQPQLSLLPTLAILCQAYLVAHASFDGLPRNWKAEDLSPALEQMGWTSLVADSGSDLVSLRTESQEKLRTVRRARWWLDHVGFPVEKQPTDPQQSTELFNAIEHEWKQIEIGAKSAPKEVVRLLDSLKTGGELSSPKEVAEAYCILASRLGGSPCLR